MKSLINTLTDFSPLPISVDPNLVFVCDSKTGSITLMLIADIIDFLTSDES